MAAEDAHAAWDWLGQRHPQAARYIFGHSLGGAIAIDLAREVKDEKGVMVEGTFTSIPEVLSTFKWGWLPVSALITQRFESVRKVSEIGSPLLVVHGSQDSLIAPALGRKLYDAAQEPKRFVLVEGDRTTTPTTWAWRCTARPWSRCSISRRPATRAIPRPSWASTPNGLRQRRPRLERERLRGRSAGNRVRGELDDHHLGGRVHMDHLPMDA